MRWSKMVRASIAMTLTTGLCVIGGAGNALADPSTPFAQCPSVGYAPTCDILLNVNADNSVSVLTDPSVGPYDGGDDTLVGIVNNSDAPVPAITVNGPGTFLSVFDGDGLCSFWNSPAGCPFGGTGYEGPGTSLRTDPSLPDEAEVDFNPALQPGQTAYFSLEGALAYAHLAAREGGLGGGAVKVLYVHGLAEDANNGDFGSLFQQLHGAHPSLEIDNFEYYEDTDCQKPNPAPSLPTDLAGMPVYGPLNDSLCDSSSSIGINVVKLENQVKAMTADGSKVILVGYSMGGSIIRGMLAYSLAAGDGVAQNDVDSVFTLHGVQQGSWLADGVEAGFQAPLGPIPTSWWEPPVQRAIFGAFGQVVPTPDRPAVINLETQNDWFTWANSNSANLPVSLPTFNTYGDMKVDANMCFFFCQTVYTQSFGDMFIMPGSPDPTATPAAGGARFLPNGGGVQNFEWDESQTVGYDYLYGPQMALGPIKSLMKSPRMHTNYRLSSSMDKITVPDCQTGNMESETTALLKVLNGRVTGHPYLCDPGSVLPPPGAPSAAPPYFGG
jgi:hypothetical protein